FSDQDLQAAGAQIVDTKTALGADIVFKIHRPTPAEIAQMKKGALLISLIEPYNNDGLMEKLAEAGVDAIGMELVPRTSRAQSMDVLSSQGNVAGYRAVLEAAAQYGRFFPMMMTAAGSAKPAKLIVLGAGVAGLQAIAVARKLGAAVEAYDVRGEVKEQILSLGAKFIEIDVGEEGAGSGGYARELSEEGKKRLQAGLIERLKKADVIVSTANIPGRKSPTLIPEEAVKGMRHGSVIIDMAAANGGNCPLSEPDKVVTKYGVKIVGWTNYPAMVGSDASGFFAKNLMNLLLIMLPEKENAIALNINLEDDIIAAALVTHQGKVRFTKK
ncbi:Re/Si-specific NAD(P)(+) transhydrogenase subunit alpha, partial [Bdellovibrionota bacterium FG-2]